MFGEVNESVKAYGVGGHRHVAEIEQELAAASPADRAQPRRRRRRLPAAPHPDDARDPRRLPRPARPGRSSQAELDDLYAAAYAGEPFVQVVTDAAGDQARPRQQRRPGPRPPRRADRPDPRHRRHRQPRQGRRRPGGPGLQPRPRPAGDGRPRPAAARAVTADGADRRAAARRCRPTLPPVERRAAIPAGFVAGGTTAGIKASGRPGPRDHRGRPDGPAAAAARLHAERVRRPRRSASRQAHLRRDRSGGRRPLRLGRRRLISTSGCANAATGAAGERDQAAIARAARGRAGHAPRADARALDRAHRHAAAGRQGRGRDWRDLVASGLAATDDGLRGGRGRPAHDRFVDEVRDHDASSCPTPTAARPVTRQRDREGRRHDPPADGHDARGRR